MNLPYAEDIGHYWKTSQTSSDIWLDRTRDLIISLGGYVYAQHSGSEPMTGKAAFLLVFEIDGDRFKIIWPVLPTRKKTDERAAKIQSATFLYHDTKAKCLKAIICGAREAFFSYLMLPDGRTASQASVLELSEGLPRMFLEIGTGKEE